MSRRRSPGRPRRPRRSPALPQLWADLGISADYASISGMTLLPEANRLVAIGRHCRLAPRAAKAWRAMCAAANADGITLRPLSGFRSVRRQTMVIRRKLAQGIPLRIILQSVAAPGCSEHHTGRALDLGDDSTPPLEESFAATPAFRWLRRHARRFHFHLSYPRGNARGFVYEPWHWCWRA